MKSAQPKLNESNSFLDHFEGKYSVYLTPVLNGGKMLDAIFLNNRDAGTSVFCSIKIVNY